MITVSESELAKSRDKKKAKRAKHPDVEPESGLDESPVLAEK